MARYTGGLIRSTEFTGSRFGTTSGMFTLGQQLGLQTQGGWPSDYNVVLQFNGTSSWECPPGVTEIEYVVVGGGGGAGSTTGGGGGGGGLRLGSGLSVISGKTYTINIGGGGTGGTGRGVRGSNGEPSGFLTEGHAPGYKQYYVSVGNPGAGNKYYIKEEQTDTATGNIAERTLQLYEGSTYRFDTSHPTTPTHPFHFSENPNGPAVPYSTQSGTQGSPGAYTQLVVPTPAPDLYYYCTSHSGMGGSAETPANVTISVSGGGGGGSYTPANSVDSRGHHGGSGGGGSVSHPGHLTNMVGGNSLNFTSANGFSNLPISGEDDSRGAILQGFNGGHGSGDGYSGAGGGGGGAGQPGFFSYDGPRTAGNGGNGLSSTITGLATFYAGGGGGAGIGTGTGVNAIGGLGGGAKGSSVVVPGNAAQNKGNDAEANLGGGGGGGSFGGNDVVNDGPGGVGGSGVVLIKYKNKISNRVYIFEASGVFRNDFGAKEIEFLMVGGGGGAGGCNNGHGGGGGAGGFVSGSGISISNDDELIITVGAGGGGGVGAVQGSDGTASNIFRLGVSITPVEALGGGGGGRASVGTGYAANNGASGGGGGQPNGAGGSSTQPSPGLGSDGGTAGGSYIAGGGGGASQDGFGGGTVAYGGTGGDGGNGHTSTITGSNVAYAGGGGAGNGGKGAKAPLGVGGGGDGGDYPVAPGDGSDAIVNTGSGGGGGSKASPATGGSGSSGIVVIKITG